MVRQLLIALLVLGSSAQGASRYEVCNELTGVDLQVCESTEYSKGRLRRGSEEDLAAAQDTKGFYRPPVAETDSTGGAALMSCAGRYEQCRSGCNNSPACATSCHGEYNRCAGSNGFSAQKGVVQVLPNGSVEMQGASAAPDSWEIVFEDDRQRQ